MSLVPVDDEEVAVVVDGVADIAGVEPAVADRLRGRLRILEVAGHDVRALEHDLAVLTGYSARLPSSATIRICWPRTGRPIEPALRSPE